MRTSKIDVDRINRIVDMDFSSKETQKELLGIIEKLCSQIIELQKENQELKDENMRLKGEKGKPEIKASVKTEPERDAKKMENGEKKEWKKGSKKEKIKIDRTEIVKLDKIELPNDLEFKGYEERIIQNITIWTDNVMYKPEKYYSALEGKTYTAKLPESLQGTEFGSETKALAASLYYKNRVTENKIASFLNSNGLLISEGTVSNHAC